MRLTKQENLVRRLDCDECGKRVAVAVELGLDDGCPDAATMVVCFDCVRSAMALVLGREEKSGRPRPTYMDTLQIGDPVVDRDMEPCPIYGGKPHRWIRIDDGSVWCDVCKQPRDIE